MFWFRPINAVRFPYIFIRTPKHFIKMNICKSILKRLGISAAVLILTPIVTIVLTAIIVVCIPIITLACIVAVIAASDEQLNGIFTVEEVDPDMVID